MTETLSRLEELCAQKGLKMTQQRRVIARVLSDACDHPDVNQVYERARELDNSISIATVYRTVGLFEDAGVVERHDFGDGRARYEEHSDHHHHLIDVESGDVIEFQSDEIEEMKKAVANRLGYELVDCRLELFGKPLKKKSGRESA